MSLTQIDKDFLVIREKILTENETFLKKFQNNKDYFNFKKSQNKSLFIPILLVFLFCSIVAVAVYFLHKFFPDFFIYEFIIGIALIIFAITFVIIKLTKKLKQDKLISKHGFYCAVFTIEKSYDKLISFMTNVKLNNISIEEKIKFYMGLRKILGNISSKLSNIYSKKTKKIKKLKNSNLDWNWLIKYLYNFGKFCYNKKQDCKSFIGLLSI